MEKNLEKVQEKATEHSETLTIESNALNIIDRDSLKYAVELKKQAKDNIKVIENAFKDHKADAWKTHQRLCQREKDQLAPFKSVLNILDPKIQKYQTDLAAEEQRKKEEAERAQRELEAKQQQELEKSKEEHVENLIDAGAEEKAEMVMEAPTVQPVAAVVPDQKQEKVKGAGITTVWKARVLDFSKVPDMFKIIDDSTLQAFAKKSKGKKQVDGVEFYETTRLTGK